jgi:hypothetical protein
MLHIRGVGDKPKVSLEIAGHRITWAESRYVYTLSPIPEDVFVGYYGIVANCSGHYLELAILVANYRAYAISLDSANAQLESKVDSLESRLALSP